MSQSYIKISIFAKNYRKILFEDKYFTNFNYRKHMKKLLLTLIFMFVGLLGFAQIVDFRTTSFTQKHLTPYGWTDWSYPKSSNMLLRIDANNDLVTIDSPRRQVYKIIEYDGSYTDYDGDQTIQFTFVDQDGDIGTMRLMQRRNGRAEVYIQFTNIIWCYSVIKR